MEEGILHKPSGFAFSVHSTFDTNYSKYEDYIGEDAIAKFWEKLEEASEDIENKLFQIVSSRKLNDEEIEALSKITKCYLCQKEVSQLFKNFHPMTGDFLGLICKSCLNVEKIPKFVPIVIYDFNKYGVNFITKNRQYQKNFSKNRQNKGLLNRGRKLEFRVIDFNKFIDENLEEFDNMLLVSKQLENLPQNKIERPRNFVDDFEKFKAGFPEAEAFYDKFYSAPISEEDYQRCTEIWKRYRCKTLLDYYKICFKFDVLRLENIFEYFRKLCYDKYKLDPAHYNTIASYAFDSMLKYLGINLELFQDTKMIDFVRKNIRGGIVQCTKRHVIANNKFCPNFDPKKTSNFIIYLDANNAYGWANSQLLPHSNFKWLEPKELEELERQIFDPNLGYFLEVDLDYPKTLQKKHCDLPFCYEKIIVPPNSGSEERPTLNFFAKKNYVLHHQVLQQCLSNGLVLKKVHKGIKFHQEAWLQPYIDYNTQLRIDSKNNFEKKLYKLLNNSMFGKTLQKTNPNAPSFVGFTTLELSKMFIFDFHYTKMLPKFKNRINLLYIDTDGLIYEIFSKNFYDEIKSDPDFLNLLDTSDLDPIWGVPVLNKKIPGKMKDACGGKVIFEFLGVQAKTYFLNVAGKEVKKAYGLLKRVKEESLNRYDYARCVLQKEIIRTSFWETTAHNEKNVLSTLKSNIVLSPDDNKRKILEDGIHTLPWGHQEAH